MIWQKGLEVGVAQWAGLIVNVAQGEGLVVGVVQWEEGVVVGVAQWEGLAVEWDGQDGVWCWRCLAVCCHLLGSYEARCESHAPLAV